MTNPPFPSREEKKRGLANVALGRRGGSDYSTYPGRDGMKPFSFWGFRRQKEAGLTEEKRGGKGISGF